MTIYSVLSTARGSPSSFLGGGIHDAHPCDADEAKLDGAVAVGMDYGFLDEDAEILQAMDDNQAVATVLIMHHGSLDTLLAMHVEMEGADEEADNWRLKKLVEA